MDNEAFIKLKNLMFSVDYAVTNYENGWCKSMDKVMAELFPNDSAIQDEVSTILNWYAYDCINLPEPFLTNDMIFSDLRYSAEQIVAYQKEQQLSLMSRRFREIHKTLLNNGLDLTGAE